MFTSDMSWLSPHPANPMAIGQYINNQSPGEVWRNSYWQTSNIRRTLVGNNIVDQSNLIGASPVGAAPTKSSFSTEHQLQWIGQRQLRDRMKKFKFWDLLCLILEVWQYSRNCTFEYENMYKSLH